MNQELLNAAKEFDTDFIGKFPEIDHPVKLISDFNLALNEFAQKSTEHGETINSITLLLANTNLEEFAAPENTTSQDKQDVIQEARKIVYGDEGSNDGGLKEWVAKLINDLEADK